MAPTDLTRLRRCTPACFSARFRVSCFCAMSPDVVGMGIPAVGGILYSMRKEGNLKLSQKLIHTRVYGQMTVVSMVVAMMGFQEMMRRNGGVFVVSEPEEEEKEEEARGEEKGGR